MLRFALGATIGFLLLGVVVALLPVPVSSEGGGVELSEVKMRLYPRTEDKGVVWLFGAKTLTYNPGQSESVLSGLEQGQRLVKGKLDMTLETQSLTIDQNDVLYTDLVTLRIPKDCISMSFGIKGNPRAVKIDQNAGFSGPNVTYRDPFTVFTARSVEADFNLGESTSMPGQKVKSELDPTNQCVNGKIVTLGGKI